MGMAKILGRFAADVGLAKLAGLHLSIVHCALIIAPAHIKVGAAQTKHVQLEIVAQRAAHATHARMDGKTTATSAHGREIADANCILAVMIRHQHSSSVAIQAM